MSVQVPAYSIYNGGVIHLLAMQGCKGICDSQSGRTTITIMAAFQPINRLSEKGGNPYLFAAALAFGLTSPSIYYRHDDIYIYIYYAPHNFHRCAHEALFIMLC